MSGDGATTAASVRGQYRPVSADEKPPVSENGAAADASGHGQCAPSAAAEAKLLACGSGTAATGAVRGQKDLESAGGGWGTAADTAASSAPLRSKQYYCRKMALRTLAMLLLLFCIAGIVYTVGTVHSPAGDAVPPAVGRPPGAMPDEAIRVPGRVGGGRPHLLGIMNGGDADPGQFPWLVDIQEIDTGQSKCGGSLIDPNWIITAAHCVSSIAPTDLRIVIGEHDIAVHDEYEQIRALKEVVIEPDFSMRSSLPNDIALVRLSEPAEFNERVAAIQLTRDDSAFTACSVAGWGAAGVDPATGQPVYPTALQTVNMSLLARDVCQARLVGYSITVNMTCAEGEHGADVCWGDSGGSLTCPPVAVAAPWTLVGVTSWGVACGYMQYPSVYTRVSRFVPWIEKVTGVAVPAAPAR